MSTVQRLHPIYADLAQRDVMDGLMGQSELRLEVLPPSVQPGGSGGRAEPGETLTRIRRFRGTLYLSKGLVPPEAVDASGCHFLACDVINYHLMMVEPGGRLAACLRVRLHAPGTTASGLRMFEAIRRMPLAVHACSAINAAIQEARQQGLGVAELGGWVVSPSRQDCPVTMLLPMAAWALVQNLGGALMLEHADASGETEAILNETGRPLSYQGSRLAPAQDAHHGRLMQVLMALSTEVPDHVMPVLHALQRHLGHTLHHQHGSTA